jgi:dolichol-phosphate mannosyltransferase
MLGNQLTLAVCMPVYNESEGIREFILEIADIFESHDVYFYAVDDCSSDESNLELSKLTGTVQLQVQRNQKNMGHGPSTIKALKMALMNNHNFIISVDGDGQFLAKDIYSLTLNTIQGGSQVGLGVRIRNKEPQFRKVISFVTRMLVFSKTRRIPRDANTPLRVYRYDTLADLIKDLEDENPVPNLFLLTGVYKRKLKVHQEKVLFRPRRGASKTGSTWGKTLRILPQKRLLIFSWNSIIYWLKH